MPDEIATTAPSTPATGSDTLTPVPRAAGRHYLDAKAANTRTAYRQAMRDFAAALDLPGPVQPGAITDDTLCAYIAARADQHRPATIAARISILRQLASDAGCTVAGDHHRDALRAVTRNKGARQRQAKGFTLPGYHRALAQCPETTAGRRDAALLTLAYCTASRASELIDYRFEDIDRSARVILLRRSKTDQEGRGTEKHLSTDALSALDAWQTATGITSGPILRSVNKGGTAGGALTTRGMAKIIKRLLGHDYSPHSIRVGFVQSAVDASLTIPEISLTTGQSPQTVQRYFAKADQKQSAAAKMLG